MKALKRLWVIATCNHKQSIDVLKFESGHSIETCNICGRVIGGIGDEGKKRHNESRTV